MKFEININEDCKSCKESLGYFKSLFHHHLDTYADLNMKTWQWLDGIYLQPDYNSSGHLTHFHVSKADIETLKKIIESKIAKEKESMIMRKLKKEQKKNGRKK